MAQLKGISEEKRRQILENTLKAIKQKDKEVFVDVYSNMKNSVDVEFISTGSLSVDSAIGGGFAKGRIIEIVGMPSSGKTTLALTAIANLQKEDPESGILYVDAEAALDPSYAKALGVDLDKVLLCQPDNGEQGYTVAETYMQSGLADVVVIDSIAAMRPKSEIEKEFGEEVQPGRMAKLTTSAVNKLTKLAKKFGVTVILINQYSPMVKLNQYAVSGASQVGQYYTPGGNSLMFFVSQFLEIKKVGEIKIGTETVSNVLKMTCKKNKVAAPYKSCEFIISYGKGLDEEQELISLGLSLGIISQAGSFYKIPGILVDEEGKDRTVQGRTKLNDIISENSEIKDRLREIIKENIKEKNNVEIEKDLINEEKIDLNKNAED